jgi:acetoin utilization deacetylase AcuC-like enzyme
MFRIRRVYDTVLPVNQAAVAQVQDILRGQFPALAEKKIADITQQLHNPRKYRFQTILFVAEGNHASIKGCAVVSHAADLHVCLLNFIAAGMQRAGRGIGGALYERVREEALHLGARGIFLECLPDDPGLCADPDILRQNRARLRFYEYYGALPIVNTRYETPITPGSDNPPYLVYDPLGRHVPLSRDYARQAVRAILEGTYADVCSRTYVDLVVESFVDDPVQLRKPRYIKKSASPATGTAMLSDRKIVLVVTDAHAIHHVHERGYVETPVRITTILGEIEKTDLFLRKTPEHFHESHIRKVHDGRLIDYFKKVCETLKPGASVYPYVFPIRNAARPPRELAVKAGYYCIDTFTPLNRNAYYAATRAVDCGLSGAKSLLQGSRLAYSLVRPPGHHAERGCFGGFCYFNTAAIAGEYLSACGRVAMLDVDYHHGNGQQNIFYNRADVLTVSIHGHPRFTYPYFSGFKEETGEGPGAGFNVNYPMPEHTDGMQYREALSGALNKISRFRPSFLIIALGLDTARGDPTGTWSLKAADFSNNGEMIGRLRVPVLVVQEGGYNIRSLGINAVSFLEGLWTGMYAARGTGR